MEETIKDILAKANEMLKGEPVTPTPPVEPQEPQAPAEPQEPATPPAEPQAPETPQEPQVPTEPQPSFLDTLLLEDTPPAQDTPAPPSPSEELAAKVAELEAKLQEKDGALSKYEQNELVKALAKYYELESFDPKTLLKEMAGEDFSVLPYKELVKRDLKAKYGIDGEILEQAVDKRVLEFETMEEYEKVIAQKELVRQLEATSKKSDSELLKTWEEALKNRPAPVNQEALIKAQQEQLAQIKQQETAVLKQESQKYVGQNLMGYQITEEDMQKVQQRYDKYVASYVDDKDQFEVGRFLKEQTLITILPNLLNAAKEEGKREALKGRIVQDTSRVATPGAPLVDNDDPTTKFLKKQGII